MAFAIQFITRPKAPNGMGYGAYLVNDGTCTFAITSDDRGQRQTLYVWLGHGNAGKGRDVYDKALTLPSVTLNAAQYNTIVSTYDNERGHAFTDKG